MQDDVDHAFPGLEGQLLHRHGRRAEAGVVEEEVEAAAERLLRLGEQVLDVLGLGHVAAHAHDLAAAGLGHGRRLVELLLAPAGDHHVPAVALQGQRRCPANAGAAARDNRNLALETAMTLAPCSLDDRQIRPHPTVIEGSGPVP